MMHAGGIDAALVHSDVGFGWIVFAGFLLWVFQVLRAGARGDLRRGPTPPRAPRPDRTQREGAQLEQMLRHLETRLGQEQGRRAAQTTVVVKGTPAPPAQPPRAATPARPTVIEAGEADQGLTAARPTPIHRLAARQLREAFVWNEILGPPLSLRD